MAFFVRELFSVIGFLFVLLFTARGIGQIVFTYKNHFSEISMLFSGSCDVEQWSEIIKVLKHPYSPVLDRILMIFCGLIMIHGVIGIYYAILTDYNITKMTKEKAGFYLQILSAFGATFVVSGFMMPAGDIKIHSIIFWLFTVLVAVLSSFHIAKGFYNASITLGISVSNKTKCIFRILAWIIAIISILQISTLLL